MRHLPLGLKQLHLERPRVDRGEEIAFLDDLALPEKDLHELAVDPALYRDRVEGGHGAETVDIDVHIALFCRHRCHGNGTEPPDWAWAAAWGAPVFALPEKA